MNFNSLLIKYFIVTIVYSKSYIVLIKQSTYDNVINYE